MWLFNMLTFLLVAGAVYLGFKASSVLYLLPFPFFADWFYNYPRGKSIVQLRQINPNASIFWFMVLGLIPWFLYYGLGRLAGLFFG